jgi:hypothetical protein
MAGASPTMAMAIQTLDGVTHITDTVIQTLDGATLLMVGIIHIMAILIMVTIITTAIILTIQAEEVLLPLIQIL